jgi:hypothetical protein
VLHKRLVMLLVIRYVEMVFIEYPGVLVIWVHLRVMSKGYVYQNTDLVTMLVHGLHLVLNLKGIILCEIYH